MTDHKTVGLQYAVTSSFFLAVGFLLMLVMRLQLAWPGRPLPSWLAPLVGEANAPGGIVLPEFYNQLVAMHGTVMIFLAVVPLATGAFGTLLVPRMIGATSLTLPRTTAAALWLHACGGGLMLASFFVVGGAANSGWTSYPPLAVLATSGQTWWLVAMLCVSASAVLWAIAMIDTIVRARAPEMTLRRLPFFVWAQLVTALLLLLAFPALQAAAIFQLMDRTAGSSFFLPSGLVVGGIPLQDYSGGGNPLLWQHLFWFLGHPEVYVLVLPAIGIVSEVIVSHTGRPLWGRALMVMAVLFLGLMSMLVWAHHMFLTGMGTTLTTFFQITTMVVSIPSVILITALVMSLWGGSIRFSPAMLFALAFLPMFGIGGLSGLPLGLAASDVILHDTYYVVAHFHYLVAPGTVFALFAGIYHFFPVVIGRRLDQRLGRWHFWLSFFFINNVFLPMFFVGLAGVNRRLYDAGLQYALGQPYQSLQRHMTWSAIALGVAQIPFVIAVVNALRVRRTRGVQADAGAEAPALRTNQELPSYGAPGVSYGAPGAACGAPGVSYGAPGLQPRRPPLAPLGPWLAVAWLTMFVGSLLSGYVLIRAGSTEWTAHAGSLTMTVAGGLVLLAAASSCRAGRLPLAGAAIAAGALVVWLARLHSVAFAAGRTPAAHLEFASWFTITGVWLMLAAALAAAALLAASGDRRRLPARAAGLRVVFGAMSLLWFVTLSAFSRA